MNANIHTAIQPNYYIYFSELEWSFYKLCVLYIRPNRD